MHPVGLRCEASGLHLLRYDADTLGRIRLLGQVQLVDATIDLFVQIKVLGGLFEDELKH